MPKYTATGRLSSLFLLKRINRYFYVYKFRLGLAAVAMAIVAACEAGTAYLVKPALDDIFINKNVDALKLLPIAFIGLIAIKGVFRFLQNYEMNYCGLKVLEVLRDELYNKIIRLPVSFFEENQVGMLMSRILNDIGLIRTSLPSLIMLIREFLTMLGLVAVVVYRDPYLASWAIMVLPLAFFPVLFFGKKLRKLGLKSQIKVSDISVFLQEIFSGVRVVKAFANEEAEKKRFDVENLRLVNLSIRQTIFNELTSPIMEFIGAVGMGLVIWYGGSRVISGESTPGTFFSFMAGILLLYDPIKKFSSANNDIQRALAGAERVFEIIDSDDIKTEEGGDVVFEPPFKELAFKDVTLIYPGRPTPALNRIDLTVSAGERVAIVGPSGSGKTTLVNLLPRFYEPQQGEVLLNGKPLREYTLRSLRRGIGMVSQEAFLFNATVRANIAYGLQGVDDEAVERAARAAYAHDFILSLPEGYDTIVGERGVKLSGGQKQRITIARALLKNPPLLVLDEATSALDTESERIVQLALENLMQDRTSIVIAHRLSTVLSSDVIVVMEAGKIMAMGSHTALLSSCPLYTKLYQMQFQDETRETASAVVQ